MLATEMGVFIFLDISLPQKSTAGSCLIIPEI